MPVMSGSGWAVEGRALELSFGGLVALAASDFQFPASGVTAVIGPNGSGKSTVLAAVAGLHRPSAGEIVVLGDTPRQSQPRVAFVPQSTKVNDALPVTVREVVSMGRYAALGLIGRFVAADRTAVDQALQRLDLMDLSHRHLRELSGGQRQRVFVAQGLVQDRQLLLMDEPTSALDLVSSAVIESVIDEERLTGRPLAVTTHDLGDAQRADHVVLLANRVVAEGPPESVLTAAHLSEAYRFDVTEVGGRLAFDDPAHAPAGGRHTHVEPPDPAPPRPGR